jgi:pimeloyl-ACP methyl ester carboxylesterase
VRRAVAVLLVLGLLVGGAVAGLTALQDDRSQGLQPSHVTTTTPQPGATDPPARGLAPFYSQQLSWSLCRDRTALCATLQVPLDYRLPRGGTIGLALLKVPAADPGRRIGSLVVNPGGPGVPGTDYAANAQRVLREPLLDAYDVVGFDPRGAGASDPVDCLSDAQLDDYLASDPDPDTPAEVASYAGWVDALGRGCQQRSGVLAAHVTTVEAARDMDVLRAALGESALTYLGASYGTKLGATYADLFPDKVGRLVLDGAVDLSLGSRDLGLQQAAGFETALRAYVQHCLDEADCFLGDSVDAGVGTIRQLVDSIDARPLPTAGERELEVGNAVYGIVMPLYSRSLWSVLDRALQAGLEGDGTLLLQVADLYNSRGAHGYTDNSVEANYAIDCLDDPAAISADQVPAAVPDFEAASPTFGRIFAWGLTGCGGARVRSTEPARVVRGAGAPPIVVVGTTRDPATPYAWAVALADQLESGVLVSRDGDGHTGYNEGSECVDEAVEGYLVDGTVPRDGLRC